MTTFYDVNLSLIFYKLSQSPYVNFLKCSHYQGFCRLIQWPHLFPVCTATQLISFSCFKRHIPHLTRSASIQERQPERGKVMAPGFHFMLLRAVTMFYTDWHRRSDNLLSSCHKFWVDVRENRGELHFCNNSLHWDMMQCFPLNCISIFKKCPNTSLTVTGQESEGKQQKSQLQDYLGVVHTVDMD